MRRLAVVGWIAGAVVLAGAMTGCSVPFLDELRDNDAQPTGAATTAAGPITFAEPLQLRAVTDASPRRAGTPTCATGKLSDETSCYGLADETLVIKRVKHLRTVHPNANQQGYAIELTLHPEDARAFGELTGRLAAEQTPRNQLAIVVDGKVVTAPAVLSAITAGEVQISGNFSEAEAEKLVRKLTG